MDYDDNEFQGQNIQLAGEGCSKISSALLPYALPKFEFNDSLEGHLRFDSLVENEVFLGITSQEDNQWIEEYSCGSSGIELSSSAAVESRHNNVWSEATSSESVEMLLKSVGQEEKSVIERLGICDEPGSLTKNMDPNLNQDDGKNHVTPLQNVSLPNEVLGNFPVNSEYEQSQEAHVSVSGGGLNSVALSKDCNLSVSKDNTFDDVFHEEADNLAEESMGKELPSVSRVEIISASIEELKVQGCDAPISSSSAEPSQGSKCAPTGSLICSDVDHDQDLKDNMHEVSVATSTSSGSFELQGVQEGNTKSEDPVFPESNVDSLSKISPIKNPSVDENEYAIGKDAHQITLETGSDSSIDQFGTRLTAACLPDEVLAKEVHTNDEDAGSMQVDCKSRSSEPDVVRVDQVAAMESDKSSSSGISDGAHLLSGHPTAETNDQPKSPIFGVSLVHQDNMEKVEVGLPCEDNSQNESSPVESVVVSDSKNQSSLVKKESSPDMAEKIDVHCSSLVENCNANQIEKEPDESNTNTGGQECSNMVETSRPCESSEKKGNNSVAGGQMDPKESVIEGYIGQDGGSFSSLEISQVVSSTRVSTMELSQSAKDKQDTTNDVMHDSPLPSKSTDDVEGNIQPVNATQEGKNLTFEVSMVSRIMEGPSTDTSSSKVDARKLPEVSPSSQNSSGMTSQIGVKGKSERKPRRKSVGKENARKDNHLKETTPAGVDKLSASGRVIQFEEVKLNKNAERSDTKLGGVLPLPKLPDLNNATPVFQQPFTDIQQVQLRAQILVYGSLISGSPPEEPHMIAAFGQSDGGRTWEGVWRACLERLHVQKAQAIANTPTQSRSVDQGVKHASVQNKVIFSPSGGANNKGTPGPMIPLSLPLWSIANNAAPSSSSSDNLKSSRTASLQALSPLHPAVGQHNNHPSWLSQPFAGQWVATSPIPAFNINTGSRFPALPITTPVKESKHTSATMFLNSGPEEASSLSLSGMNKTTVSSDQLSTDPKSRKRKKGSDSATVRNVKRISDPSLLATPSAPVLGIHLAHGMVSLLAPNQTDSVTAPVVTNPFPTSNSSHVKFPFASPTQHHHRSGGQNMEKAVVISEETLSKVEESKVQALDAAECAAAAVSRCHDVWSQLERQNNSGLNSDDEAKLVSSAVSLAAAASVAKVAAAAAKIASDVAEQARSMVNVFLSNKSENFDQSSKFDKAAPSSIIYKTRVEAASNLDAIVKAAELAAEAVSQAGKIVAMSEPFPLRHLVETGPEGYWKTQVVSGKGQENSGDLAENQTMEAHENSKRKPRVVRKGRDLSKTIESVSVDTCIAGHSKPEVASDTLKENFIIKEGCLVEVYKDGGAWFGAHVLSLKDGKALVCYTEIQSDEGQLKEWVALEVERNEVPKTRIAHPLTLMHLEGTKKRSRTDFVWSSGDRVDVWIQDRWREGVVMETNKIDPTCLTVKFSGEGVTAMVRSWFVRPSLIWKDGKWVETKCSSFQKKQKQKQKQKRMKVGSASPPPVVRIRKEEKVVELKKQEESSQESLFSVGRDGKEGPGVVFGVPKPAGKKQKFMDVSKHYDYLLGDADADGSNHNYPRPTTTRRHHHLHLHDSVKFTRYLIPQAPGGMKNNNSAKEKQAEAAETKPRKPPVPRFRSTLASSKSTTTNNYVSDDDNQKEFFDAATTRLELANKVSRSERPVPEHQHHHEDHVEPSRRSNRKIQPTSRLLEGLQTSITISKIPAAASHFTPKGNTNNG